MFTSRIYFSGLSVLFGLVCFIGCTSKPKQEADTTVYTDSTLALLAEGTFGYDVRFLEKHKPVLVLSSPDRDSSQVVVVAGYQGRVMTSTAGGVTGNSYGWMNHEHIASGKNQPHMNAYGGEDRFWLGPEGGQYSIYFQKGADFKFDNWQVPALIDTATFDVVDSDKHSATFAKKAQLTNYSGTAFDLEISRKIAVLGKADVEKILGNGLPKVRYVAYETANTVTNTGADWKKETGLLSIWILGMFNSSEQTAIAIPFKSSPKAQSLITTNYFGQIPPDRLVIRDSVLFFKADATYRSKLGVSPQVAKPWAGSYDSRKKVLTLVQFDLEPTADYVNSLWEVQKNPFKGDAVNSYNDGPNDTGSQMGRFYELESSSPAKALKKGESMTHHHRTFHFEGDEAQLGEIARKVLGVELADIQKAFEK